MGNAGSLALDILFSTKLWFACMWGSWKEIHPFGPGHGGVSRGTSLGANSYHFWPMPIYNFMYFHAEKLAMTIAPMTGVISATARNIRCCLATAAYKQALRGFWPYAHQREINGGGMVCLRVSGDMEDVSDCRIFLPEEVVGFKDS